MPTRMQVSSPSYVKLFASGRNRTSSFPLVKPSDLQSEEDQEPAAMFLSLITKIEHVKLESYIAEERRKHLEAEFARTGNWSTEQLSGSQDWRLKEAEWNYSNHYAVLRRFLAKEINLFR